PGLIDGSAVLKPQDLTKGSYFGGRRPEDGRVDWSQPAKRIHDLVRAVAPPYPGAFTDFEGKRLRLLRTRLVAGRGAPRAAALRQAANARCLVACADGGALEVLQAELDGKAGSAQECANRIGARRVATSSGAPMKRILILGVNGFIGHHLSKRIVET